MLGGGEERVVTELRDVFERELRRLGLLYRIFVRVKTERSIRGKVVYKSYGSTGKRIQDLLGLRVVLYFGDDCAYVQRVADRLYKRVESVIDAHETDVFGPVRFNMICRLPDWSDVSCV